MNMVSQALCPVCNRKCDPISALGQRHGRHIFDKIAGIQVRQAQEEFSLFNCMNCGFLFKPPILSESELISLYSKSIDRAFKPCDSTASLQPDRRLKLLARLCEDTALAHASGRRVLEVGCSNGIMLSQWSDEWRKYGIEPSTASANLAVERGINIIGSSIYDVKTRGWDCIISVDTIEHIYNPLAFLSHAKSLLAPDGVIITLTGDMSVWLARLAGPRYWYASFPEHLSFLTPKTFKHIACRLEGKLTYLSHYRWGSPGRLDKLDWVLQGTKFSGMACFAAASMLPRLKEKKAGRSFPVMTAHRDHFITVLSCFN